jgi:hypothetical protein
MDPETQRRLAELDRQLTGQGFVRIGQPMGLVLGRHSQRDFALNLVNGQCYAFAALGGPGSVDTDVMLTDSSGEQLEADTRRDRDAMIRFCASSTGAYSLHARMYDGEGALFTVGYARSGTQQVEAQRQPVIATTSTAGAGLSENVALLDADMHARGYESYGSPTTARLAQGGTRDFEISLDGGRCYAILAVGDTGVRDLDLVLLDARGNEVDRDIAEDARPTVRVCPRESGRFSMRVRMTTGEGSYVYAPYRWPRGTRGPFGLEGLSYVRLAEVTALLSVEGFEPDPGFTPQSGQLRREHARASHDVRLSGQCYAIVVVGGDGVRDLDITLSRGSTPVASETSSRNAFPSLRHCAEADARYSIGVIAVSGSGRYHVQVFSRHPNPG